MKQAIAYIRVSTHEQAVEGVSLQAQQAPRASRIRGSWETVCGTPKSPRSEAHGRSLD